jgi:hypothetical protein
MTTNQAIKGAPAPRDVQDAVRSLVDRLGGVVAAERLGIRGATLARILAGLPVIEGTIALVRGKLGAK